MSTTRRRWHGLAALVTDAVDHGVSAVERVHLQTAGRPFDMLAQIPGAAEPAREIRGIHDAITRGVYSSVRVVNRAVAQALDVVLDEPDEGEQPDAGKVTEEFDAQRVPEDSTWRSR